MFKICKYVLFICFLFVFTANVFLRGSIKLGFENNIKILNNYESDELGVLGLKLELCSEGRAILLELESNFNRYNGFLLVSENQLFTNFYSIHNFEYNLLEGISSSSYENLSESVSKLFIDAKFINAKNLVVGDSLNVSSLIQIKIKNIFNVRFNKDSFFLKELVKNNYSFFLMNTLKKFYMKNFFSINHFGSITFGAIIGGLSNWLICNSNNVSSNALKKGALYGSAFGEFIFWMLLRLEKKALSSNNDDLVVLHGKRILDFFNINFLYKKIKNINDHNINLMKIDFVDENKFKEDFNFSDIHKELLYGQDGNLIKDSQGKVARLITQQV